MSKDSQILGDYQRVGSRFIPPMASLFKFDYISWSSQTMPELVWWDALIDATSHRFAVRVADEIAGYFKEKAHRDHWWAFASDYERLSKEDVESLQNHLERRGVMSDLADGLEGFLGLYPSCPLADIVGFRSSQPPDPFIIQRFESRLHMLRDKRSRAGILIQAQAVLMGFLADRLRVMEGLALADFPEVEHYPSTGRSVEVGAAICATVNMLAGNSLPQYADDTWVQYFWNRSLELSPLTFPSLVSYEHQ